MLSNFVVAETFVNVKTHQSVFSDGNYIWTTNAGNVSLESGIYRYSMAGALLTSHNLATNDITGAETDIYQLNGMHLKNGKLYVSAMNYPHGSNWPAGDHNSGHLYQRSYITRWDAMTLAYEAKWAVGDSSVTGNTSAAKWSEGVTFALGYWWVAFHGDPVIEQYSEDVDGNLVFVARHTLPNVNNASQTWNAKGFEEVTVAGDYFYLNRHVATNDLYLYVFKWTGTGFTYVTKHLSSLIGATGYNQGVNIQPNTNIMWWCRRTGGGTAGSELGDITKVFVRGFDLYDITNGVYTSNDNGVKFTNSNGVIISK